MKPRLWSLIVLSVIGLGLVGLLATARPLTVRQAGLPARRLAAEGADPDAPAGAGAAPRALRPASAPQLQVGQTGAPTVFRGSLASLPNVRTPLKPMLAERENPLLERNVGALALGGPVSDRALQTRAGLGPMPAPQANFDGIGMASGFGAGWPPDTNGDVGPNHYIQSVNNAVAIYTKTTHALAAMVTLDAFFSGLPDGTPCKGNNQGDPIVLYDAQSGRWLVTDFAFAISGSDPVAPYYECLAVSRTADPVAGGWWLYAMNMDSTDFFDYPKLGVWSDGLYMTGNMFPPNPNSPPEPYQWPYPAVWALNRDDMIAGNPIRWVRFDFDGLYYWSLLPANYRGAQPRAGTPALLMSLDYTGTSTPDGYGYQSQALDLWQFGVNWGDMGSSVITGPAILPVSPYVIPVNANVTTPGSPLDTLGDRMMMQLQYRYRDGVESLWAVHTVTSTGNFGVRWYEVRDPAGIVPVVYQQGTYQPGDGLARWMPSLAVDGAGNMAVGYSAASASVNPAIRYAGRLVTDTLNTLGGAERTLIAGGGAQQVGWYSRWGDYSAMTIDPTDDCTFWYTTEYYGTIGTNWQTRIGSFQFPSCVAPLGPPYDLFLPLVTR